MAWVGVPGVGEQSGAIRQGHQDFPQLGLGRWLGGRSTLSVLPLHSAPSSQQDPWREPYLSVLQVVGWIDNRHEQWPR
jgi:hypothetical protein